MIKLLKSKAVLIFNTARAVLFVSIGALDYAAGSPMWTIIAFTVFFWIVTDPEL